MKNRVKVERYLYGLFVETNSVALEGKVTLGLKSPFPNDKKAKI